MITFLRTVTAFVGSLRGTTGVASDDQATRARPAVSKSAMHDDGFHVAIHHLQAGMDVVSLIVNLAGQKRLSSNLGARKQLICRGFARTQHCHPERSIVILSAAKDLTALNKEILRCAQNDNRCAQNDNRCAVL
jgi:hypothetical protein